MKSGSGQVNGQGAKKVLVVDDDEINRTVVRVFMEHRGCIVIEAPSGEEALKLADLNSFDVVVMDLSMPHMDGFETTQLMRAGNKIPATTPIFALTAHNPEQNLAKCLEAGMNGILSKPFAADRADQLMSLISGASDHLPRANAAMKDGDTPSK